MGIICSPHPLPTSLHKDCETKTWCLLKCSRFKNNVLDDLRLTQFGDTFDWCKLRWTLKSAEGTTELCQLKIVQNTALKTIALYSWQFEIFQFSSSAFSILRCNELKTKKDISLWQAQVAKMTSSIFPNIYFTKNYILLTLLLKIQQLFRHINWCN